jgi:hypothetical protein
MSSISGSTTSTQNLFSYLQSLAGSQSTSPTASTTTTTSGSDSSTPSVSGHHHHGGGKGGGASAFFSQVQSAVTSALQSAQSSGSTSDPNTVIQDAIAQVFKNQQNITGSTTDTSGSTTGTSDSSTTGSTSATDTDGSTAQSAFAQLLQSNGVDPEEFHNDFLSAIQSVQSGATATASSVFSAFPTGSAVDTLA